MLAGSAEFDLVFNAGVLEHYTYQEQVALLQGMASRSRRYVLVLVPNRHCYWYWIWRLAVSGEGSWPYGKEVPIADLGGAFEAHHHIRDVTFQEDTSTSRTGSGPANLATIRAAITTAIKDAGYLQSPKAAATTPPWPRPSAFTASIRANADIHGTRRSPGGDRTPENCGSGPERGLVGFLWGAPGLPSTHAIGRPKTLARLPGAGSRLGPRGWQSVSGLRGCRSPVGLQGPD